MEDLPNKMRDVLGVLADVDLIEEAGHDLVRITVAPYPYPVSYKGEYHVRIGSTKQMLKGPELNRFLISKTGKRWDSVPVPDVNVSQLKKKRIRWFRRKAGELDRLPKIAKREDDEVLIEKLRLKEGDLLRRAALLLFHDAPDDFFTGALIKIAYFKSDSDLRFQDVIQGDLFTQIDQAMDLLTTKYLQAAFSIEGTRHTERLPIPEEALREAVINAVAHKDYGSGNPIQISVYDDKLMIWNSGQLSKDWTIERLYGKHPSIPFNPDVANQMFRAGNIEAWGTGIDRMVSACDRHGCPPPEFEYESIGLMLTLAYRDQAGTKSGTRLALSRHQVKTLEKCRIPQSAADLTKLFRRSDRTKFRNQVLVPLIDAGLLEMTHPDKPNSPLQKYQTTEASLIPDQGLIRSL